MSHHRETVTAMGAPEAAGPYSHAVKSNGLVFISGQVPIDPETGNLIDGDIAAQTRRVFDNLGALLKAAGLSYANVVRTTVFLADMNDFAAMNQTYATFFSEPYPARSTVQVSRLPKDARIEIDVIAAS
jgi:2-iminobutanoate/2-iminopropanoate deaminase